MRSTQATHRSAGAGVKPLSRIEIAVARDEPAGESRDLAFLCNAAPGFALCAQPGLRNDALVPA